MSIQIVAATILYLLALACFIIGIFKNQTRLNWGCAGLAFWAIGGIIRIL